MDPGLASLKSAARAGVVMPAVFAFADKVIGNPQTALFAAFGSFAMLVLVDFALRSWYVTLGDSFVHSSVVPPPHVRDSEGRRRLLECVRAAVSGADGTNVRSALVLLWMNQHLDNLWRLESHLGRSAVEASNDAPP